MRHFDRRDFLKASASTSALLTLAALDNPLQADEKKKEEPAKSGDVASQLRVAVVGVHGRGMSHVDSFTDKKKFNLNTVVTHICDVDSGVIGRAMKMVEERQKK